MPRTRAATTPPTVAQIWLRVILAPACGSDGPSLADGEPAMGITSGLEQLEIGRGAAPELLQVDLDALHAPALGVDPGLGLDAGGDEHPPGRGQRAVEVEACLVAQQLVDAGDLADPLDLDDDGVALGVAAQQVDRTEVGRVLAPDELEALLQGVDPGGDEPLELGFDAVLLEAGIVTELERLVGEAPRGAR